MKRSSILVLAILFSAPALASSLDSAQAALPPVLQSLLGEWRGSGTVTGRASEISMSWSRQVGAAFVQLRFRNQMAAGGSRPAEVFEAHGYYRAASAAAPDGDGTWIDSRGFILPVVMALEPDALTSDWGSASTERGRTVYRLTPAGTMDVIDSVRLPDGSYREFGRSELRRTIPALVPLVPFFHLR
jgi:hypothetical protein